MRKTAIVMPCYNEEKRLPRELLATWVTEHQDVHFVLVNDGSTDGTLDVLRGLAADLPDEVPVGGSCLVRCS